MMQADNEIASLPGCFWASTCPASGSIAALPKWNSTTEPRNTSRSRRFSRSRNRSAAWVPSAPSASPPRAASLSISRGSISRHTAALAIAKKHTR
jgi:hypothetical protein